MNGFTNNSNKPIATFHDIFELLSDIEVYSKYIPNLTIGGRMNSPLGDVDNKPSFSIFYSVKKGKYIFKEFRYGYIGDCVDFVRYFFGFKSNTQACMQILLDFGIDTFHIQDDMSSSGFSGKKITVPKISRKKINLEVTIREWEEYDIQYWAEFGISLKWLEAGRVFPIKYYYFNKSIRVAEKYAYVYVESKDNKVTYKIYQPYSKDKKWFSNNDSSVWELWDMMPQTGDLLIITKSRKDALSIMATMYIPSIALQAEGTKPKDQIIDELKSRFRYVILLYDNDYDKKTNWGRFNVTKLVEMYNLPHIEIPDIYQAKDYSDLVKTTSDKTARKIVTKLLKEKLIEILNL